MKLTFNNIFDFAFDVHSFICMIFFVNWNVRRRSNNEFSFYCTTYFRYYWKNHLGNFVGSRKYSQCSPFSCVFLGLFGDEVSDLHRVDPLKSFKIKINFDPTYSTRIDCWVRWNVLIIFRTKCKCGSEKIFCKGSPRWPDSLSPCCTSSHGYHILMPKSTV